MSAVYEIPEELYEEYVSHKKPVKVVEEIEKLGKYAYLPTITVEIVDSIAEYKNGGQFMSVVDLADYLIHHPSVHHRVLKFIDRALKNVDFFVRVADIIYRADVFPIVYTYFFRLENFLDEVLWSFTALKWANLVLTAVQSFEDVTPGKVRELAKKMWSLSRRFKVQYIFIVYSAETLSVLKTLPTLLDNAAYIAGGFSSDSELYIYVLPEFFEDEEAVLELCRIYRSLSPKFRHVAVDVLR